MMSVIKKYFTEPFYRNSLAIISTAAVGSIFGLLFWMLAARTISVKDIGLATAAISLATLICSMSKMGMDSGLLRFMPLEKNKDELYSSVMLVTLIISLVLGSIVLCFITYISPPLAYLLKGIYPAIFLLYIALAAIMTMQNNTMIAIRRADLSFIQNVILGLRIPFLFVLSWMGAMSILSSFELAYFITLIFGIIILFKYGIKFKLNIDLNSIKKIMNYSLGNYIANIVALFPSTVIPMIIINTIGANECAYFNIAYSIASILLAIPSAITMSLLIEGSHDIPLKENIIKTVKFISMILVPTIILLIIFGDKILLIFNREFSKNSFALLQIFALSTIFMSINMIFFTIKRIQKEVKIISYFNIFTSISIIVLSYVLIPYFGLIGIGYSWLASYILTSIIIGFMILFQGNKRSISEINLNN